MNSSTTTARGGPERSALQAVGDRGVRLLERRAHDRALAGGEPVGLDHERCAQLAANRRAPAASSKVENRAVGSRSGASGPRERLRALDRRRALARPEDGQARLREAIRQPGDERRLRPDHRQIDALTAGEVDEIDVGVDADADASRVTRDAGIAGRREQRLDERALGRSSMPARAPGLRRPR